MLMLPMIRQCPSVNRSPNAASPSGETPQTRLHELLPWHWKAERQISLAA